MNILQSIGQHTLTDLRNCNTVGAVNNVISRLAKGLGAKYFQMAAGPCNPLEDEEFLLSIGNYPIELRQSFGANRPLCEDPAFGLAISQLSPLGWRKVFMRTKQLMQREYIGKLRKLGIIDGISIPIHGPNGCNAVLMFGTAQQLGKIWNDEESLSLIAVATLQRVKRIMAQKLLPKSKLAKLTLREAECLAWVLDGKTNWEIGVLNGITARTVQFHLANAARKLGVNNRIQAAVRALTSGQISMPTESLPVEIKSAKENSNFNLSANLDGQICAMPSANCPFTALEIPSNAQMEFLNH